MRKPTRLAAFLLAWWLFPVSCAALSILDYNVEGIGAEGTESREALQRIIDYFDPDVIILQEAKGITNLLSFLAANSDYEGFYSTPDGAGNRRMIMSKYDILDESVREYKLGEGSKRTLFSAAIDLPGPHDLAIFNVHWDASSAATRENESAASVGILIAFRSANPGTFYVYGGDLNDVDTCPRVIALLAPATGLVMFTPIDPVTGSNATINSNPQTGTYLNRRIDYILPSRELAACGISGRILNTWAYEPETIPPGLEITDTIQTSDHLPVFMFIQWRPIPGDANLDCRVNILDLVFIRNRINQETESGDNWQADVNGDDKINILDLIFARNNLNARCEE